MKIEDCLYREDAAMRSYERLLKSQEKLNACITPIKPEGPLKKGSLSGVPVILKDNFCTKGIRTTAGSRILKDFIPPYDAAVTEKLQEAGAVLIGKSSMDELSMGSRNTTSFTGPVHNPYDLSRVPGGSSGGSAALVAAGVVPIAIGSDTGDSVRKPASYCGIVGVKPTYGRISRYGMIPYACSLDSAGCFATCVEDAGRLLEVLSGRDDRDMTSSNREAGHFAEFEDIRGKKALVFSDVLDTMEDDEVKALFLDTVRKLKRRGALVEEVRFNKDLLRLVFPVYYTIANGEGVLNHRNLTGVSFGSQEEGEDYGEIITVSRTSRLGSNVKKRMLVGAYALDGDNQIEIYQKARKIRRLIVREIEEKMKDADILIAPSVSKIAPLIDSQPSIENDDRFLIADCHMILANLSGYPAMSVPMGTVKDMPAGIHLMGKPFEEKEMLSLAKAIEEDTGLSGVTKEDF